ncbi:MAG: NAD-dependent epimerase/dehydratase family protein [Chloroflexota bacterium]
MPERVLVTGASGFIGGALCRPLAQRGQRVRAFHRPTSSLGLLTGLPVERAIGDILDPSSLGAAMQGVDTVLHTAAQSAYWRRPQDVVRSAVEGTRNVVDAARRCGVRRLVLTSSLAAMGLPAPGELLTEANTFNLSPNAFPYGYAKHQSEIEALRVAGDELEVVIVNPSIVLGQGDIHQISGSLVVEAARGRVFFWVEGGANFVHIADVVEGHLAALQRGRVGERYILGGENLGYHQVFETLAQITGRRPPRLKLPGGMIPLAAWVIDLIRRLVPLPLNGSQLRLSHAFLYCDVSKARSELGLGEPRPFRQAAQEAYEWYRAQGVIP